MPLSFNDILDWLTAEDPEVLEALFGLADKIRQREVGNAVQLRGLVELSNHCVRSCTYCGLRAPLRQQRYRMSFREVLACAQEAVRAGYGTIVLQSGEDPGLTADYVADLVRAIRQETPLAITLSLGERGRDELEAFRKAGADRYLLRFETSNQALFEAIHPPLTGQSSSRLQILQWLRELGFEVGSGVMVGIPGQTLGDLARDVALFAELELDMIGLGPFLPHPGTPLGEDAADRLLIPFGEVTRDEAALLPAPNTADMTCKMIALARLVCPRANIPSTTALAVLHPQGRIRGLCSGANVVMPNLTPLKYRSLYGIYPNKSLASEGAEEGRGELRRQIKAIGRTIGRGRGDSPSSLRRRAAMAGAGGNSGTPEERADLAADAADCPKTAKSPCS